MIFMIVPSRAGKLKSDSNADPTVRVARSSSVGKVTVTLAASI